MMPQDKKIFLHFIWIVFAILIGVSISYVIIEGSVFAYGAIYDKTQEQKNSKAESQNIQIPIQENNDAVTFPSTANTKSVSIGFCGVIIPEINAAAYMGSYITS